MELSRQEYWSRLPFPSPEDILTRGIKPRSPALQVDSLPSLWQLKENTYIYIYIYSHDIKRCLLLGRKAMTNLDSILKCRDMTLLRKFHLVKAMVFPVVMYGCGNWTIKKAEHQRMDAFELWCWRRLLRVP